MSLMKAKIEEAIYDVISISDFYANPNAYGAYTAIKGDDGYVYPIRTKTDNRPGFYPTGGLDFFKPPTFGESNNYTQQNIINFDDATGLRDVIRAQQKLVSAERSILTTIDNVFTPKISEDDTPEMKAVKQAIIDKHIDLDKYEPRFGTNYNNDKRLLNKSRITCDKMRAIGDALDLKISLVIEDASPDVPNPMGRIITTEITGGGTSIDSEEDGDYE